MLIDHWSHTTINRFRFDLDEGIIAPVYGRYILRVRAMHLEAWRLVLLSQPDPAFLRATCTVVLRFTVQQKRHADG